MVNLRIMISGISFVHPLLNASGILGSNKESVNLLASMGFSGIVTKTFTKKPRKGYNPPIIIPLEYGFLNAVGLANPGIDKVKEVIDAVHMRGLPVIVSIGGQDPSDFAYLAGKAEEAGADILELNMSCPHTPGYGIDMTTTDKLLKEIASNVKSIVKIPVWAKLGYSKRLIKEAEILLSEGIDALVLINTLPGMVIDVYVGKPILSNKYGGLSGPAIHPVAVYSVYKVYQEFRCDIVGVGGIHDWKTLVEMLMAGARAVQIGSAIISSNDKLLVKRILEDLSKYMEERGFKNINELIGYALD